MIEIGKRLIQAAQFEREVQEESFDRPRRRHARQEGQAPTTNAISVVLIMVTRNKTLAAFAH
jgi:hypothetical protein